MIQMTDLQQMNVADINFQSDSSNVLTLNKCQLITEPLMAWFTEDVHVTQTLFLIG